MRDGFSFANQQNILGTAFISNIIVKNAGYGVNNAGTAVGGNVGIVGFNNAFYNNTSGPSNNYYGGMGDITLTSDPFTNGAGNVFTLTTTAGGGAACKAAALVTNLDIGALQHVDSGGGSTYPISSGDMTGGFNG